MQYINEALSVAGRPNLTVELNNVFYNANYTLLKGPRPPPYYTHFQLSDARGNFLWDPHWNDSFGVERLYRRNAFRFVPR